MTEILDKTSVFCHKKRDRAPGGGGGGVLTFMGYIGTCHEIGYGF